MDRYGSDVVVDVLRELGIEYVVGNAGASWRGLHESLARAKSPRLLMAMNENAAMSIAHGYGKATGRPMAVVVHSIVGLQSGSMGMFNALIDQVPVLVLSGSGPGDAAHRRPWIDWIHGPRWNNTAIREYVKWDDMPMSLQAIPASLARAHAISTREPCGPTYVALDALLQETKLDSSVDLTVPRIHHEAQPAPSTTDADMLLDLLLRAEKPVIMADFAGRREGFLKALVDVAETLNVPVVDLGSRHNFPNNHRLDQSLRRYEIVPQADLLIALEPRDVLWATSQVNQKTHSWTSITRPDAKIVNIGWNEVLHKGFLDREPAVTTAMTFIGHAEGVMEAVLQATQKRPEACADSAKRREPWVEEEAQLHAQKMQQIEQITVEDKNSDYPNMRIESLVLELRDALERNNVDEFQIAFMGGIPSGTYNAARTFLDLQTPNIQLGRTGGAGVGFGVGGSIGAGLAHLEDDTLVISIQPDGDVMYTASALWTAAHEKIPVLFVMNNNASYGQDRMHQTVVTELRDGDLSLVPHGIDLVDPRVDFAKYAQSLGVDAAGPFTNNDALAEALDWAIDIVSRQRRPALIDVHVAYPGRDR